MTAGTTLKAPAQRPEEGARERILGAAYELFSTRGIRDVGIDELIDRAGVAKATLYRHFGSKEDLVFEFLRLHEERWTIGRVEHEVVRRAPEPADQLLAIFDVFREWFRESTFTGCSFAKVLLEMGPQHPVGEACSTHIGRIRTFVGELAREAELRDPEGFARSFTIVMAGSAVQAVAGDAMAARRGKSLAKLLITEHHSLPTSLDDPDQDPARLP